MKLILSVATGALLLLAAVAGQYRPITVLNGANSLVLTTNVSGVFTNRSGTNNVILSTAITSTNGLQGVELMRPVLVEATTVGFFASYRMTGTNTDGPSFTLDKSYNGTNWENIQVFAPVSNGTNLYAIWTNLTIAGFGYVRVGEVTNNSAANITNLTVRWYIKE